jgi:hypothetical protein
MTHDEFHALKRKFTATPEGLTYSEQQLLIGEVERLTKLVEDIQRRQNTSICTDTKIDLDRKVVWG